MICIIVIQPSVKVQLSLNADNLEPKHNLIVFMHLEVFLVMAYIILPNPIKGILLDTLGVI